jgi:hypothetical protein
MTTQTQKLISLLFKIDALLENNKKIREELIRLLAEEEEKPDITDILGIKVYLGKDYVEPTECKIKIGEDLGKLEDFYTSFEVQDCGGNFVSVKPIDIPKTFDININRELEILEEEYLERTLDLWR